MNLQPRSGLVLLLNAFQPSNRFADLSATSLAASHQSIMRFDQKTSCRSTGDRHFPSSLGFRSAA
jgi:hypothetical protein